MKRYLISTGVLLLLVACAQKKKVEIKPVEGLEEITVYQETTAVAQPTPVSPEMPPIVIPPAETTVTYTPPTPVVPIPQVTPPATPPTAYGYRVQIFASSSRENAERIANNAQSSFTEKVYVEPDGDLFKVRVGDFLVRDDANQLKAKAIQLGFRGAFVVETMINPK
ncbi:MAG: SPOR domain-containing protein [candidate division WOR-3 bacterium]